MRVLWTLVRRACSWHHARETVPWKGGAPTCHWGSGPGLNQSIFKIFAWRADCVTSVDVANVVILVTRGTAPSSWVLGTAREATRHGKSRRGSNRRGRVSQSASHIVNPPFSRDTPPVLSLLQYSLIRSWDHVFNGEWAWLQSGKNSIVGTVCQCQGARYMRIDTQHHTHTHARTHTCSFGLARPHTRTSTMTLIRM